MGLRILAIEPGVTGNTGAALRVDGLLSGLGEYFEIHRCDVQELCEGLNPKPLPAPRWRFLRRRPVWAPDYGADGRRRILRRLTDRIDQAEADVLWLAHGTTAAKLGLDCRAFELPIPVIVDAYDLLWTALERKLLPVGRRIGRLRRWRAALEVGAARRFEHRLYGRADQTWVCSELDGRRLERQSATASIRVVPNFFDPTGSADPAPQDSSVEPTAVFVGTLGYYPNREGMEWFLKAVWPRVLEHRPEARLWVVGKWPEWTRPAACYEQDGVEVKGFVESLDGVWAQASMLICPLLVGSGTRIKILEAWARRVPVVSTSVGIEGLGAEPGVHARIEDDATALADAMVELMNNPGMRREMADHGHRLWQERYTAQRVCELAAEACRTFDRDPSSA